MNMATKVVALVGFAAAMRLNLEYEGIDEPVQKPDHAKWEKYRAERGSHDCEINEMHNWHGQARCVESWECQGSRLCQGGNADLGWCVGDTDCPNMGPLDFHGEDGNIRWNQGRNGTWDQNSEELEGLPEELHD